LKENNQTHCITLTPKAINNDSSIDQYLDDCRGSQQFGSYRLVFIYFFVHLQNERREYGVRGDRGDSFIGRVRPWNGVHRVSGGGRVLPNAGT